MTKSFPLHFFLPFKVKERVTLPVMPLTWRVDGVVSGS